MKDKEISAEYDDALRKTIHLLLGLFFITTIRYLDKKSEIILTSAILITGMAVSAVEKRTRIRGISKFWTGWKERT